MVARDSSDVLLTSISVYFPLFLFSWLIFEVLRRKKTLVYEPATHTETPLSVKSRCFAWIPFVWRMSDDEVFDKCGLDAWVFLRFIKMGQKVGLLCIVYSVFLFPMYMFDDAYFDTANNTTGATTTNREMDFVDSLTIANVASNNWRLYFTVVTAYGISIYVMHLLLQGYNAYSKRRHQFLSRKDAQQYSVVVTDLPSALRRPQTLTAYMEYLFPNAVYSVYVGVECARLEKLVDKRLTLQYYLEAAQEELRSAEMEYKTALEAGNTSSKLVVKRPSVVINQRCLGICGGGTKVDAINYYERELEKVNKEITQERNSIVQRQFEAEAQQTLPYGSLDILKNWNGVRQLTNHISDTLRIFKRSDVPSVQTGEKQPLLKDSKQTTAATSTFSTPLLSNPGDVMRSSAFVSFRSLRATQSALQLLQTENPVKLRILPAPHIKDILWENFGLEQNLKSTWTLLSILCTCLIVCFWTVPTAFAASMANVETLRQTSDFVAKILDNTPWLQRVVQQAAPLILSGMNALSDVIFNGLSTREGHLSISEIQASLFTKLCYFQVFQMFFVSAVTGSIVTQLLVLVDEPKQVFFFLGSSIASQSTLFITFTIVHICVNLPLLLLRVVPRIKDLLYRLLAPMHAKVPVPRPWLGLEPLNFSPDIESAFMLAQQYLIFLLVIVFAPIAPLVGYVGALFFVVAELVYKRYYFFVNQTKWVTTNSMGVFWPRLFSFVIGALVIAQCTIIGLLSLKSAGYIPILLSSALPFLTFVYYWYIVTLFNFAKTAKNLPLDQCCDLDEERKDDSYLFLNGVYQQPAMIKTADAPGLSTNSSSAKAIDLNNPAAPDMVALTADGDKNGKSA